MRGKITLLLIIGLALSVMLMACGNNSTTSENESDSDNTITYWSMWNEGEPQQEVIQTIIDAYEEANPAVTIDVQWMGREVMSKVRNAALSGDAPDITEQSGAEIEGALINNDLIEPLNELLTTNIPNEDTPLQDVFIEDVLSFYEKEGNTYFIPYEIISSGFHYNENAFNEYGVEPPATWDEFIEVSNTLKDAGMTPLAQDGNIDFYNAYYYYWLVERLLGPGALVEAAGDESGETWGQPEYLEAAKKVEELVDNGLFADGYEGSQYPAAQTAWASGDSAMILNGSWLSSETADYASEDFVYKAFPFPRIEGGSGGTDQAELYLIGWVAPKGANTEAVSDFLAFAMQKEYQEGIVTDTKNISTRADLDAPETLVDFKEMIVDASSYHKEYDGLQAQYPDWWKTVFLPLDDQLIFGDMSAEEFIQELQAQTKEYWENQ